MPTTQGVAVVRLGPTSGTLVDYTCDIRQFVVNQSRTLVQKSPTYGAPDIEQKASANLATVSMVFDNNPASPLLVVMRTAYLTDTGELYFDVKYEDAAVSTTNRKYAGWLVVNDLDFGQAVSQVTMIAKTYPARAILEIVSE